MREHGWLLSAAQQFNHRETGRYAERLDSLLARLGGGVEGQAGRAICDDPSLR